MHLGKKSEINKVVQVSLVMFYFLSHNKQNTLYQNHYKKIPLYIGNLVVKKYANKEINVMVLRIS